MDNIQRLEKQADLLFQNIAGWENSTLQRIGKRINRYGKLSLADIKTQMQRRLETAVRNEKTTRELARASGDKSLVKRCNERIKAYQGKYAEITDITGIPEDKKRMSVPRTK